MEVQQSEYQIALHQLKYAKDLLKKFNIGACKPVNNPLTLSDKLSKHDGQQMQMDKFTKA